MFRLSIYKRLICLFTVLVLLFAIIAGCATDQELRTPTTDDPTTVDSATGTTDVDNEFAQISEEALKLFVDEFFNEFAQVGEETLDFFTDELFAEEAFDFFIDKLFVEAVTSNSITLNFTLADPSAFGIEDIVPTLGRVSTVESAREDRERSQLEAATLNSFDYTLLRPDQRIIFDILVRSYQQSFSEEFVEDHVFYLGFIRPLNGIQIQLPILLAEFNFRTKDDFETYFALLEDTRRYFSEIIEFEHERMNRGFFLSEENVDNVLEHIESYLSNREDNFLILVVNDIIDTFDGLTPEERIELKSRNEYLVLNAFLPAYEMLYDAMRKMRGIGANDGGLANLPDGKEFAQVFLHHRTDSDMSLEQMRTALEEKLEASQARLRSLFFRNHDLMNKFFAGEAGEIPDDTPENFMSRLEKAMADEFPPLGPVNVAIREVHENLQEHISPAFYLSPAVDDFFDNVVYINPSKIRDNFTLFTALAHEGFPGHMYQFVYFRQQSPHPIRALLSGIGYIEGWASYAEYASFFWAGLDETEAEMLKLARIVDLMFLSIIDLNVNAFGWDLEQLTEFLDDMGISNPDDVARNIFTMVTGVPLFYIPYTIGYIELVSLRNHAEEQLGDDFVAMEFNRFILEFGPAPFSILGEHLDKWIESISP